MINVILSILRLIICRLTSFFDLQFYNILLSVFNEEREYQRSLKRIEMFIFLFNFHVVILENDSDFLHQQN